MSAQRIDGKALAAKIRVEIAREVANLAQQGIRPPGLAVILVGDDPASAIYVRNKQQACEEVGIKSFHHSFPKTITQTQLIQHIKQLNDNAEVDGILLQLPLPEHINSDAVLEKIHPDKDVDGFHPYNLGRLAQRRPLLRPCTPFGIMLLLDSIQQQYKGKHAVVVGASNVVGRPMALELLIAGATVTVCHRFTENLASYVEQADILIAAAGKAHLVRGNWIKPGATVIDVGLTRLPNGTLTGDVDFAEAERHAAWITPVPGGVGPMTVACLLKNTLMAAKLLVMPEQFDKEKY